MLGEVALLLDDTPELADLDELEVLALGNAKDRLALYIAEELATGIQELEGIPMLGIVASREDEPPIGSLTNDSHLRGGRRR